MAFKTKLTFAVPERLQTELRERIVKDGYSLKEKSRWISEAIELLLELENFAEFVRFSDEMSNFKKSETVIISVSLKNKLDQSIMKLRQLYPLMEGVQSRIIRTAIVQKILRS